MANLLGTLVYTTLQDARDTSEVFTATVPADAQLTSLIWEAQWIIDGYIQSYGTPAVDGQTFIFPTLIDWIPTDIKLATIWISEYLYARGQSINNDKVSSEGNLSRNVSFSDKQWHNDYVKTVAIPKKVINVLDKYKNDFIWQIV
jgi:hypothetical protein